uniref:BTB domain-containing protein n=1 Tax=Macrostomum lignano TaxID=282301 RepID=A0A1I8G4M4_9PLAT
LVSKHARWLAAVMPNSPLNQRLLVSLRQQDFADVRFLVSDKRQEFAAHRVILAAASPVFAAMFRSDLSANQDSFELKDIDTEAFQNLLDYAYSDSVSGINESCVFETLYAAKKYLLQGLVEACSRFLVGSISSDNLPDILQNCLYLDAQDVVRECLDRASRCWDLLAPRLPQCSAEAVVALLSSDYLPCTEAEVLNCLIDWVDAECLRQGLQSKQPAARLQALEASDIRAELLACVRFSYMTRRQLTDLAAPSGLLNDQQLLEAFTRRAQRDDSCREWPRRINPDSL